jgi:hypothetical protein
MPRRFPSLYFSFFVAFFLTTLCARNINAQFLPRPLLQEVVPNPVLTNGGTVVEIRGANFRGCLFPICPNTEVLVGGVPATQVEVRTDNLIVVRIPAHAAGTVDISIRRPFDTPEVFSNAITYVNSIPTMSPRSLLLLTIALVTIAITSLARSTR